MARNFLAIGECMIEMSPRGNDMFGMGYAGDTFNTAWYMQQLAGDGINVAYYTAIGDDPASQKLSDFIRASGIRPLLSIRAGRSVGLYMVSLQNGERSFSYWRDSSAARTLADDLGPLPLGPGDMAYFSGITLAILPDAGKVRLLNRLTEMKEQGVTIAFDPNLRPRLWSSTSQMCSWTMKGAAISHICLPSFDDEARYFGDDALETTCARYAAQGSTTIITKNGGDPILAHCEGQSHMVAPAPLHTVVDTTAAGDSFNAAFLKYWMQGSSMVDATSAACAVSRKVISQAGALVQL